MRILIGALVVGLLAGCVSPGDLKTNKPTVSASTKKEPKQYALCVLPRWQDARSATSMSETVTGYRLVIGEFQLADELLEINRISSGSQVDFYQRVAWMPGVGRSAIESAVRDCL